MSSDDIIIGHEQVDGIPSEIASKHIIVLQSFTLVYIVAIFVLFIC